MSEELGNEKAGQDHARRQAEARAGDLAGDGPPRPAKRPILE